jgi:predicted alpha/beta hydrolase
VIIPCADAEVLHGHFIAAGGTAKGLPVLLSPATGLKQHFYLRFAQWLATQGHDVLVFDYRGIGLSLQGPLGHCRASLADWGQLDQAAALEWLLAHTGAAQAVILGHSAGGQMLGLLPNHRRVARLVGVAASTGWFKAMHPAFALKARFGLRIVVPLGIRLKGYGPTAMLGLGENLPAEVARQWGQWCAAGGYATNAVKNLPERDFHRLVRTPITVLHAEDDDIANPATVADLLHTFPSAPTQTRMLRPVDHGLKSIGHIDWFRASHQPIWPLMAQAVRGG